MKKIISILLSLIVVISISSCGNNKANDDKDMKIAELESQLAEATKTEKETTTKATTTKETTTKATTTKATTTTTTTEIEEYGTRRNPANFGEELIVTGHQYGTKIEYVITLSGLVRGAEAEAIALEQNMYTEWADDEEPIIFNVDFELLDFKPSDDEPFYISSWSFDVFDSSFSEVRTNSHLYINAGDEFGGEVYEGGSLTGIVAKIIPKGDRSYFVIDNAIWVQLPEE